ncbi:MAG: SurA N-terminal domain-containing protein [Myxococcales bacterium]|nr:SurA N-terminal domain-containing protein [Myxococcales bacterium]
MLNFFRRTASSVFAWIILGVLALVFGLSFGPASDNLSLGTGSYVKVHGESLGDEEFRFQANLIERVVQIPKDARFQQMLGLKEEILDAAVEREVLYDAGRDLGLQATDADAEELVLAGQFIVLGETLDWLGNLAFNYDIFKKSFLAGLQISEPNYLDLQRRELLARTVRDLIAASVVVSEGELRAAYDDDANRLSLRYARYEALPFGDLVDPTPAEIEAFRAANLEDLRKQFTSQGSRFAKLPKQARVFLLEVRKPEPAEDGDAAAAAERDKAAQTTIQGARKRIEGGEDFRKVAREISQHESSVRGGELGWVAQSSGSGVDAAVDTQLATLEVGKVSDVIDGSKALYLVLVRERREGDIDEAGALPELAEEGVRRSKGRELARAAAEEDLAAIAAGAALTDVFAGGSALGGDAGIEQAGTDARRKVRLDETGSFAKGTPAPGLGQAPEILAAAWAATPDQSLLDQVFTVGDDLVLVGVVEKTEANDAGFAEARGELYRAAIARKAELITAAWTKRRCIEAKAKGEISANEGRVARLMTYETKLDAEAKEIIRPYEICDRVGDRGGKLRMGFGGGPGGE